VQLLLSFTLILHLLSLCSFDYANVWLADVLAGNCVGIDCQDGVDKEHLLWDI
jgi:hypothetical protein